MCVKMCFILVKLVLLAFVCDCTFAFDVRYEQNGNARCLSMNYNFRFFTHIILKKCVKECATRPMCRAVNYHRSYQLCELLSQDVGTVSDHAPPCQLIKKADIVVTLQTDCDQCIEGETCDINELTGSGKCEIEECKPLTLTNGHILGNMKVIGSRIVYECDRGYKRSTDVMFSDCLPDGSWSGDPDCILDRPQLGFCPGFVLDDGTTFPFGTLNSWSSFESSCSPASIYCSGNGKWETIPDCSQLVTALYLGCYQDCQDRLLEAVITPSEFNPATTDNCILLCSSRGYNFAYTEATNWCHCGNEVLHFTRVSESECNSPCEHNSDQICGGSWRSSLYDLTIQTGRYGIINNEHQCASNGSCIPECRNTPLVNL